MSKIARNNAASFDAPDTAFETEPAAIEPASLWEGLLDPSTPERPTTLTRIIDTQSVPGVELRGHTAFFRHNKAYRDYLDCAEKLAARTGRRVTLMTVGGSIGAEAYTMAFQASARGIERDIRILNLDISQRFSAVAAAGVYPVSMVDDLAPEFRNSFMECAGDCGSYVRVREEFRRMVEVLPSVAAENLDTLSPGPLCDIAVMSNLLGYMDHEQKGAIIKAVAGKTRHAVGMYVGFNTRIAGQLNELGLSRTPDGDQPFTEAHVSHKMVANRPLIAYGNAHPR